MTSAQFLCRLSAVIALGLQCLGISAQAQSFPSKPVRIVVPFPAGGPVDAIARAVGQQLSPALGQPVVIENRPGANTMIAAETVARAVPDGHTVLFATDATMSINPLLYNKISYKQSDFSPVTAVFLAPEYLIVSADVPANNLQEFIAYAKSNPGKLNYGSFGLGSNAHLAGEAFNLAAGTKVVHVPFKGAVEVFAALLSGDVQVTFTSAALALQHMKTGKLKVLAVMSHARTKSLPNVPTFTEGGLPGFDSTVWFGFFVPAKTPSSAVEKLSSQIAKIAGAAEFEEKYLTPVSLEAAPSGPEALGRMLQTDREKYSRYVKVANIKLD